MKTKNAKKHDFSGIFPAVSAFCRKLTFKTGKWLKIANFKNSSKSGKRMKQMPLPLFWVDVGVKK